MRALERNVIYLAKWAEETENNWQDYFTKVSPSRAVYDIRHMQRYPLATLFEQHRRRNC